MSTQDIVQKLWNLCNVLRDDGITYHQYVTELTYILFLKMLEETGEEAALRKEIEQAYKKRLEQYAKSRGKRVDELTEEERNGRKNALYDYSWKYLTSLSGIALKKYYNVILTELGKTTMPKISNIYTKAVSSIEEPKNLEKLIKKIDELDWYEAKQEGLGDLYEGLLQKNADEKKSGAGQYFTPRPLIDVMTELVNPQLGERCFDPACGTFGFMIAAYRNATDGRSLYKAFTGELTAKWREEHGVSIDNWKTTRFDSVAAIRSNLVDPAEYQSFPHIAPDNIEKKTGVLLEYHTIAEDGVTSGKHRFYSGQILYSKIRPYLSKAVVVDFDGLCSADMYPIEAYQNARCLWYYMLSDEFLLQASTAGSRSVLPKINQKELSALTVHLPTNDREQEEIARILDELFDKEQQTKEAAEVVLDQIDLMKKSILARAFRGELGTNDPSEESAVELLKRTIL